MESAEAINSEEKVNCMPILFFFSLEPPTVMAPILCFYCSCDCFLFWLTFLLKIGPLSCNKFFAKNNLLREGIIILIG